jgi:hypothetical protein
MVAQRVAEYSNSRLEAVGLTEPFTWQVLDREGLGDEVLIGQTALEKLDLFVDCVNQRLVPNPAHPHQPVSKVK